jgi:hypothetical protein
MGLWGLAGGAIVDGVDFAALMTRNHGRIPVRYKRPGQWIGEAVRLTAGAGLAAVLGVGGYVKAPLGPLVVGIAAPAIVERLSRQVPKSLDR